MVARRICSLGLLTLALVPLLAGGRAAPRAGIAAALGVAPDLDARLARFEPRRMSFHGEGLSERERRLVNKLVEAAAAIEQIYWRQSDPQGLELYRALESSGDPLDRKVRRFLKINGSRYDLVDELRPFVGREPAPPGRALYPPFLTVDYLERTYLPGHPGERAALYDPYRVVRSKAPAGPESTELATVPYHSAFAEWLEPAARSLREAAELSEDPAFQKFLRLRADALLSDDYLASDLAWLDLRDPKFDLILAPYETYLDNLLGVKTSYGAAVLVRDEAESQKLAVYQKFVPELQEALPLAREDRPSKRGHLTPMEVMDAPYRTGDLLHGYQAVADNLPNDARVHEAKGSKKIFFKNFLDARVNVVILPLARRLLREDQAGRATAGGYLASTLAHEISHELGPDYARTAAGKREIREAIGGDFGALEEGKADVVGMFCLKWLADRGALSRQALEEAYISYVAGNLRTMRFGVAEPHGRAELAEFNYLVEHGAVVRDEKSGRYAVVLAEMPRALEALARELLAQEATGDRARTAAWFAKYAALPAHLEKALGTVTDIPVDIEPLFSLGPDVR